MFKPTASLGRQFRRLRLTTKKGPNKGFYKGTRTGTVGQHTKHGGFEIDFNRVRTYVVPDGLVDTTLTPFIAKKIEKPKADDRWKGMTYAQIYLQRWKEENGRD